MKIKLIVGLPGSGKTTYAKSLVGYHLIDDIKETSELSVPLQQGLDVVITDPAFCLPDIREQVIDFFKTNYPKAELSWIFFENDPAQCLINAHNRKDGRFVDTSIKMYSKDYKIPLDAVVLPVYKHDTDKSC